MNIAFYVDEMNLRGVANSTYQYALNNKKFLGNNSIIFYNKLNYRNKKKVIDKFKKKFLIKPISKFDEIDNFKEKLKIDFLYTQKSGNIDNWHSKKIKTLIHAVYPQKLKELHGHNYAYISEWLSLKFSNGKIPFLPYIINQKIIKKNLRKKFKIKKNITVFGCHGGESSFNMKFTHKVIINLVKKRKDVIFIFLNINKFCTHPQIKFLKGTIDEKFKKKFVNTCDAMIYGRSLGESFGLACGEFAVMNKDIISYKFNLHQSHKFNIPSKNYIEYDSYNSLFKILDNYKKKKIQNYNSKYKNLEEKKIMLKFKKIFLQKKNNINLNLFDKIYNVSNFFKMNYLYLRHKFYNHYYNFFESKFLIK